MSIEQYSALINILPQIEDALKQKGEKIPRPNYDGQQPAGSDQDDGDDEIQDRKANIEATSDEDE
jgi:hypothetical protein